MSDKPIKFTGFARGTNGHTPIPNPFFADLLPLIDNLAELKLTLHCFWALQQREGDFRYIRRRDLVEDRLLLIGLDPDPALAVRELDRALARATERGTLLAVLFPITRDETDYFYFMNTERGRRAIQALEQGEWQPGAGDLPVRLIPPRPNIFALYEANIGMLTPMIADVLRDAEDTYPSEWFQEAFLIAVERNIRNWKYIESILKRWFTEGKSHAKPNSSAGKTDAATRAASGEFGDYERFWDAD